MDRWIDCQGDGIPDENIDGKPFLIVRRKDANCHWKPFNDDDASLEPPIATQCLRIESESTQKSFIIAPGRLLPVLHVHLLFSFHGSSTHTQSPFAMK
jgi:hypothetical protein